MKSFRGEFVAIHPSTKKPIIIVSKKISTKAVVRNKLRRQLKELLRQAGVQSGIVRLLRRPDPEKSFALLKQDIERWVDGRRSH